MHYLGVTPGAVNPFAVMNDRTNAVQVVLDTVVLEGDPINFHPLDNAMTTAVSARDMVRFLEAERHVPTIMDFGGRVSE
jgi:Ala-tRNA(Pro) deacylase